MCPHCWVQGEKVQSGATLIVSPSSISFQWIQEIQKHVKHKVCHNNIPSGKLPNSVPFFRIRIRWIRIKLAAGIQIRNIKLRTRGSGSVILNYETLQHQLPVETGDTEACQAQALQNNIPSGKVPNSVPFSRIQIRWIRNK